MTDTYWAEREGARWDVYGKQRGWMAQADTEDDARLIVAALTAQQAQQPAAAVPEGWVAVPRRLTAENGGKFEFLGATFDGYRVPWGAVKAVHKAIVAWAEKRAAVERKGGE